MADKFPFDVGLAFDLKNAFLRNGWETAEEVKRLATGDVLRGVRQVVLGKAEIVRPSIPAPDGGRIYVVRDVPVGGFDWCAAIEAGCPETATTSLVWQVGGEYSPVAPGHREIILANFRSRILMRGPAVVEWAEQHHLRREGPWAVWALARLRPFLHEELGLDAMAVVATETCSFAGGTFVPCTRWNGAERFSHLRRFGRDFYKEDWFAFGRE